jgi:hypothetical protein
MPVEKYNKVCTIAGMRIGNNWLLVSMDQIVVCDVDKNGDGVPQWWWRQATHKALSYFLPRTFAATFGVLKVETRILSWETILLPNNHNAPQGSCTMLKAVVMLVTSKTLLQLVGLGN